MGVAVNHVDQQAGILPASRDADIAFGKVSQAQNTEKANKSVQAFTVDFGSERNNTGAYGARKSGVADMLSGEGKDLKSSRDMDIVLSHTLSAEDYQKAKEDGYDPSGLEAGETVTIVDHIKASLLRSGEQIAGVTDGLSREQLTEITGSEALAGELAQAFSENDIPLTKDNISAVQGAIDRAKSLTAVTDEQILYMVENDITPGIDNLYLAAHAAKGRAQNGGSWFEAGSGYLAQSAGQADFTAMQGQIDDVIRKTGYAPADATVQEEAKKIISGGVALTPEHLERAISLRALQLPPSDTLVAWASAAAIADGKAATKGNLVDPRSMLARAYEIDGETKQITDDGIRLAIEAQEEDAGALTLRDMMDGTKEAQFLNDTGTAQTENAAFAKTEAEQDPRFLQARLQLEEVRLSMSVSVNMTMLRRGFAIDTSPMEQLIDELRQAVSQQAEVLFGQAASAAGASGTATSFSVSAQAGFSAEITQTDAVSRYRLYTETNFKVEYLRTEMPLGTIGALKDQFKTDTLDDIFSGATTWKVANSAYETMQTEVRRDLGDSIRKAFRNADALLKDEGLPVTEDNLRAVRILGYNRMEVTAKNVAQVASWDAKLNAVLHDLKPAAVLDLIRDGKNPLKMTLDELSRGLSERMEESDGASDDKYARFLYKLEQAGGITEAERISFIGIYRMFETLQRTDHAAIGTLLNTGADISIRNLLTATRTMRTADGKGIDVRAAESFHGYEKSGIANAIDTQIDEAFRYYSAKADSAFAHLEPEKLAAMEQPEETMLPEFAEQMERLPEDAALNRAYDETQLERMREALSDTGRNDAADTAMRQQAETALRESELPVTASNLETMQAVLNGGRKAENSLWKRMGEVSGRTNAVVRETAKKLLEGLDSENGFADTYKEETATLQETIREQMISENTSHVDCQALSMMNRQLSMNRKRADRGSFDIPVETKAGTVSMHVTLRADGEQGSGVQIAMDTEEAGFLTARFTLSGAALGGMISTTFGESPQTRAYMEGLRGKVADGIRQTIGNVTLDETAVPVMYGVSGMPESRTGRGAETASAGRLLRIAKVFAEAVAA